LDSQLRRRANTATHWIAIDVGCGEARTASFASFAAPIHPIYFPPHNAGKLECGQSATRHTCTGDMGEAIFRQGCLVRSGCPPRVMRFVPHRILRALSLVTNPMRRNALRLLTPCRVRLTRVILLRGLCRQRSCRSGCCNSDVGCGEARTASFASSAAPILRIYFPRTYSGKLECGQSATRHTCTGDMGETIFRQGSFGSFGLPPASDAVRVSPHPTGYIFPTTSPHAHSSTSAPKTSPLWSENAAARR